MKTLLAAVLLLRACNPVPPTPKPIVVNISPSATEVYADGQATFHATVDNTDDKRVVWTLRDPVTGELCSPQCGTISQQPDGSAIFTPAIQIPTPGSNGDLVAVPATIELE